MIDQDILPIDAINEFYRLKDTYETDYYKKYVEPIIKSKNSKREKRINFSKLPKNECINCKRNVGTLFSIKSDSKNNVKKYIVKCGDINDPCPLDIEISYGFREPMGTTIRDGLKIIEKIKMDIIKEKNNSIFFNKNVTANFENIAEELKNETENVGFIMETNILRNNNPEKYAILKKATNDFGTSFLIPFKQSIDKYKETNNTSYLNTAITFYINEMIPKLQEIQTLKYDVNMVEYTSDIYKLIQLPNSLENNEFYFKKDDKIVKVIFGTKPETTKTSKSKSTSSNNSKTRKRKLKSSDSSSSTSSSSTSSSSTSSSSTSYNSSEGEGEVEEEEEVEELTSEELMPIPTQPKMLLPIKEESQGFAVDLPSGDYPLGTPEYAKSSEEVQNLYAEKVDIAVEKLFTVLPEYRRQAFEELVTVIGGDQEDAINMLAKKQRWREKDKQKFLELLNLPEGDKTTRLFKGGAEEKLTEAFSALPMKNQLKALEGGYASVANEIKELQNTDLDFKNSITIKTQETQQKKLENQHPILAVNDKNKGGDSNSNSNSNNNSSDNSSNNSNNNSNSNSDNNSSNTKSISIT
jgi:hypothetical protein